MKNVIGASAKILAGSIALQAAMVSVVYAQSAPASSPGPNQPAVAGAPASVSSDDYFGLPEIVVTAQKRSENVQNVPIAISAVTAEQIDKQRVSNINAIASQIPNLQIASPYGDAIPVFSLRGISAVDYSQNQSSPVALYVDEVYKGLPVLTSLQIFDVDRVEVLRGPQGTLYGKNTTGGAINVFSKQPSLSEGLAGYFTAGYGRYDHVEASGGANLPLLDDVLVGRVAFTFNKADGFVKNVFPGSKPFNSIEASAVRASLLFEPASTFNMLLRYTRSKSTPTSYGLIADNIGVAGPGGAGFGTGFTRDGLSFYEDNANRTGRLRINNESLALTTTWNFSDHAALTTVTAYDRGTWLTEEDGDGTPFSLLEDDYYSSARALSQDVRLASTDAGKFKWLIGAYYYRDSVEYSQLFQFYYSFAGDADGNGTVDCLDDGFTGCGYSNELKQIRRSYAFYTQENYEFDNGITLTGGLRYTKDRNHLDYYRAFQRYLDPVTGKEVLNSAQTIIVPPVDTLESDYISGKLGISYEVTPKTMVYANVNRGYRGGSFNGQALLSPLEVTTALPERLDAIEGGIKSQLFDNRLRANAAVFYYDYRNQQFLDVTSSFLQILYNAPKSRLWGAEVELTGQLTPALSARFNVSYLDAKYQKISLQGEDLSGNRLIIAPTWTLSGGVDWKIFDSASGSISLHTDSHYSSRQFNDAFNTQRISQPSYSIHDARIAFDTADGSITIAAWMTNIFETHYRVSRLRLADSFNLDLGQRGRPREYGIQASYRF